MKTALRSLPSGGQTDPPAAAQHNEAVILMTASLSAQTKKKTVDTHKIQFPLHHDEVQPISLGVMLNLVEPSSLHPASCHDTDQRRSEEQNAKNPVMERTVLEMSAKVTSRLTL